VEFLLQKGKKQSFPWREKVKKITKNRELAFQTDVPLSCLIARMAKEVFQKETQAKPKTSLFLSRGFLPLVCNKTPWISMGGQAPQQFN
jgi:hypothetical protein